ncbi:MAG: radical SAM protein [Treponemataceae bacterium]|nr:radical SAM protein [Treponemataceae bacterium]
MNFVKAKSILSSSNGMNIYRGCTHGCIYCDSRSSCYHTPVPFENIEVKENALELLEIALKSKRNKCMIGTGSMCDPYMPLEKSLCYMQKSLELIEKYGFGVTVITKSDLILRDLDTIERINKKTKAVVQITLTTFDDELCKIIEPNVSTTSKRVEVLKECYKRNIPTVVWFSPFLPYINDNFENLCGLLDYCISTRVKGILNFGIGLTLREGNREYFYKKLDEHFSGLKNRYIKEFGNRYEISSSKNDELMSYFYSVCRKNKIMCNINEIFSYLHEFPKKDLEQGLLF